MSSGLRLAAAYDLFARDMAQLVVVTRSFRRTVGVGDPLT
jgi:hypothetical protein